METLQERSPDKAKVNQMRERGLTVVSNEEAALEQVLIKLARAELGDERMLRAQFAALPPLTDRQLWKTLLLDPSGC